MVGVEHRNEDTNRWARVWFEKDEDGTWLAHHWTGDQDIITDLIFHGEELHQGDFLQWAVETPASWIEELHSKVVR